MSPWVNTYSLDLYPSASRGHTWAGHHLKQIYKACLHVILFSHFKPPNICKFDNIYIGTEVWGSVLSNITYSESLLRMYLAVPLPRELQRIYHSPVLSIVRASGPASSRHKAVSPVQPFDEAFPSTLILPPCSRSGHIPKSQRLKCQLQWQRLTTKHFNIFSEDGNSRHPWTDLTPGLGT